jgi:hypothetical protein
MGPPMNRSGDKDDGFLDRWSRRKRLAEDTQSGSSFPAAEAPHEPVTEPAEDTITPEELAALPAPEDFTEGTDITPFLRRGVPAALKNAALRRSWMLTPAIRDHKDLAVDYAWDWNVAGGVPGSGGEVAAKGVADLIARMSDSRRKGDESGPDDRDTVSEAASDVGQTDAPQPGQAAPTHAKRPPRQERAEAERPEAEQDPSRPRHGGARPA